MRVQSDQREKEEVRVLRDRRIGGEIPTVRELDGIRISRQTARPRQVEADDTAQEDFRKTRSQGFSAQLKQIMQRLNSGAWMNTDSA